MKGYKRTRHHLVTGLIHLASRLSKDFFYHEKISSSKKRPPERLESLIALLFIFDFLLNQRQVPDDLRQGFLSDVFKHLSKGHTKQVDDPDPVGVFEERFNQYADYGVNKGSQWFEWLVPDLYQKLKGCHQAGVVQKNYPNGNINPPSEFYDQVRFYYQFAEKLIERIIQQQSPHKAYQEAQIAMGEEPVTVLGFLKAQVKGL
jgi:hypothetical protein